MGPLVMHKSRSSGPRSGKSRTDTPPQRCRPLTPDVIESLLDHANAREFPDRFLVHQYGQKHC